MTPIDALVRMFEAGQVQRGGFPYVLVLMQLEHDSNFVAHSPYDRMSDFTDEVLTEFARSAPRHHRLVFKAHPLEDGAAASARRSAPRRASLASKARAFRPWRQAGAVAEPGAGDGDGELDLGAAGAVARPAGKGDGPRGL